MKSQISFQKLINKYKIHDENNIKGFFGDYRFLSNFHLCDVYFEGILYPSSEHAYMASKSLDISIRKMFMKIPDENQKHWGMKCADARKVGQTIELRPDWDNIKYDMMLAIVFDKFWRNHDIRQKLIDTGDKYLEETNHWMDFYWGYSWQKQVGQNNLGKILMKVRNCLKN